MNVVRLVMLLCIVLAVSIPICGISNPGDTAQPSPGTVQQVSFRTVQDGSNASLGSTQPHITVIRNADGWENFLNTLYANQTPKSALPIIDFSRDVLVAAVDKTRPSLGYSLTITKIEPSPTGVTVYVSQVSPGRNCMNAAVMSQPYHFVATPVFSGEAALILVPSMRDCRP